MSAQLSYNWDRYWDQRADTVNALALRRQPDAGELAGHELQDVWNRKASGDGRPRCCWCGSRIWLGVEGGKQRSPAKPLATVEHVQPLSQGGLNRPVNIDFACHPCNAKR